MMLIKRYAVLVLLLLATATFSVAQKADAAFVVGGSFVSDSNISITFPCGIILCTPTTVQNTVQTENHVFFEGAGAFRMVNAKAVSLFLEVPVAGIPSQKVKLATPPDFTSGSVSSVFVTPSLRLKLLPGSFVSPWGSIGGGWARYSTTDFGPAENKGALQFGGGVDFKTSIPHLGFRAEVRDFVTPQPVPNVVLVTATSQGGLRRHNVLAGGGVVVHF